MIDTTFKRVSLVVGALWLGFGIVAALLEAFVGEGGSKLLGAVAIGFVPTVILWHFTGVLRPVLNWFRGS